MPIVNVEGIGQVNFPDSMSNEQISEAIQRDILPQFPEVAAKQPRTWGEAFTDVGASLGKGIGTLAQIPGQLYGLATGDVQPDTGLQGLGRQFEEYSESFKSPVLKAKEALRSQKIAQAEGFFEEAGAAIGQTIKDPALITSFFSEQVPNLIGMGGGGILTKVGAKLLFRDATEAALAKVGTYGARASEAAMQGADIGAETYEKIFNARIAQGATPEEAQRDALMGGRVAAIEAGAITFGTSFGAGSTIERALTRSVAGAPKQGIIKGTLGELASEGIEEGGGQLVSNIELQKVAPETDVMKGVGAATGLGAIGGALFGLPASFVNKANQAELERAKKMVEDAKRRAAETKEAQEVQLAIGYDPKVEGSGVFTPIIVNPDGTTTFPSERNQFAPVTAPELSEAGFAEKYGIPTEEELAARIFNADTIKSFGISPKANLYKNKDIIGADISKPSEAAKVKAELEGYLKKYPNANAKIRQSILDYLARPEFQPVAEKPATPTEITQASITPEADEEAIKKRLLEGFKNRPEIKKIYEDYDKVMKERDADKAALSAFNNIVTPQVIKSFGIPDNSPIFGDQDLINADLTDSEVADRVRTKLLDIKKKTKSAKIKENIDKYLNRAEFITPSYVDQFLNPPREEDEKGLDHFVFVDSEGNIQSKYGTIYEKNGKKYAKYAENKAQKGGERELSEGVFVNPTPDQIELATLYKAKEKLMKEPDDFKAWLMKYGVKPYERADIGLETRTPHKMFRDNGLPLDDLVLIAIEDGILHEPDFQEGVGGVESMREYIRRALSGEFVPTMNNTRNMMDLENLQNRIDQLEEKVKGVPEEAVAEEVKAKEEEVKPTEDNVAEEKPAEEKPEPKEEPKKKLTAKDVLAGMAEKEAAAKNQSREGMTPNELEIMDMADAIEEAGEPGFANSMRQNVLRKTPLTEKNMEFYRQSKEKYLARKGKAEGPVTEEFDINKFVEGYDRDKARLKDQADFFGTKTSKTVEKSNDYIKKLAKKINDLGYKVEDVTTSNAPKNVKELRTKISEIAASTMRLMREQEALDKGYKRADIEKHGKTLDTLQQDFAEADAMLGEEPQAAKATMEGKDITQTPEFKKWFKGSKVVNKDGSPKVMYHGTNQDISKFFNNQFFAYSSKAANSYAFKNFYNNDLVPNEESEDIAGANITPVYINAKKIATPDDVINLVKKMGIYNERELDSFLYTSAYDESYEKRANRVIEELKKQGFDAIDHYDYDLEGNYISSLQVFEPNQIKSIYNKAPTEAEGISESKSTMEEKKNAEAVANEFTGGKVVWQDGNLALIRVYNRFTGDPIYIPALGTKYFNKNIDQFTEKDLDNSVFTEKHIKTLRKAKKSIEEQDAKNHKENPFIKFDKDGVALSKDIDPKLAGVIAEWKKLFGLNRNIYISTVEDAIANRDNFTGPHRSIAKASFNKNEFGVTQVMPDGSRYILFKKSTSITKMLETIAHEMGHAHMEEVYENASPEIKKQLKDEHLKWLANQKDKTSKELLHSLRAKKTAETTKVANEEGLAKNLQYYDSYWTSFSEWYADQVARWATTSEKPVSVIGKFFAKIANGLRKIFSVLKNKGYLPNETFKAYMDYITTPEAVKNNPIRPLSAEDQQPLFSRSQMKASFDNLDQESIDLLKKSFVREEATVDQKFEKLKDNFFERFITGMFDEFRAIKKYTTEGYMMARLSKSIDGGLQGLLEHGQVYLKDGALDIRPNTKGLLQILEPLGKEVDQYQIWKALNRDARMPKDKRSFDDATLAIKDKLIQGEIDGKSRKEVYEKALNEENQLNKSVLDVALETGLIDRASYQVFSNDIYYIPFYKHMEDGDVNSVNTSSKLTGQYFSKALKGGEKQVNDLMENVLLNWSHILSAAMKNQAALKTVEAAESMGAAVRAKPMDGKYPPNTVKVMENGKTSHFELTDPDLVDAISTISYLGPKSAFLDVAKGFTNALRYGVTLSPAYKVRNLIRDSLQSAAVSELGANMFENVYNGLSMTKKGDPTFMSALAGGAIFEMGTAHEGDQAKLIKRLIDKGVKEASILDTPEKIKGKLQDLLDAYNELGNKFENANRLALYKKLRESGKTHLEASYAARDLMDFSMQGQFRVVKVIGSVVPFFNARLQGLYKLGRDGISPTYRVICNATTGAELQIGDKEKAQRFMVMASAIALASLALYGMYKDDEDFQRREDWDRDNFWWFKIGETAFRIPKPFEIGAIGTIAERTYEQIADENVEGKVFANRMNAILLDTFSLNPIPQMMKPMIDLYANKDSFTGAPIESAGMERLSKQERQNDKTSGIAKALGGISAGAHKVLTFNPDAEGFSPIQMDYAIKAYFGWLGATAVSTADLAVEPFQEGTRVRKPVIDTLAMGFIKTEPETQSKYMTQFYQNNANLQSALADMRHYAEIGEMDKVAQILEEKGDKIALSKVYDKATKQMAELRKQSRMIEQAKDIPTDEKRAEMNRIKILMSEIAKEMERTRKTQ